MHAVGHMAIGNVLVLASRTHLADVGKRYVHGSVQKETAEERCIVVAMLAMLALNDDENTHRWVDNSCGHSPIAIETIVDGTLPE